MSRDLSAAAVARRLERLRAIYLPETEAEARRRLAGGPRPESIPFAVAVERRLAELRALCELTTYLHRGQSDVSGDHGGQKR